MLRGMPGDVARGGRDGHVERLLYGVLRRALLLRLWLLGPLFVLWAAAQSSTVLSILQLARDSVLALERSNL
jgi:hypothetical protein